MVDSIKKSCLFACCLATWTHAIGGELTNISHKEGGGPLVDRGQEDCVNVFVY